MVHTFGWYLRRFVKETKEQGGTPIICSLDAAQKVVAGWALRARQHHARGLGRHPVAQAKPGRPTWTFTNLIARRAMKTLGRRKGGPDLRAFTGRGLHTGWDGAVSELHECVVAGLKGLKDSPLAGFLSGRGQAVAAVTIGAAGK